jgi:HopA1 effector protein family
MTTTITELAPRLRAALDDLHIDRDTHSVTVGDETVMHDTALRLRQELGTALYRHWHSGSGKPTGERDLRRDHRFEDLLREATPHRTSKTPAVVKSALLDSPFGRHVLFDVGRVRVQVAEADGPHPLPAIGTRTMLELPAIRPALSPGFYLVNGSAGGPAGSKHVLRVYLHIDESSAAPAVWHAVLAHLESQGSTYRAKVLAKASGYPRRDAIVLYLSDESWPLVDGVVASVQHLPGRNDEYSVLTSPLAEGIAYAWEPMDARVGWDRMSFGQHRTAVIAGAISAHLFDGVDLHVAVTDALIESNTDATAPHRNSDSPDFSLAVEVTT